jgi:hypothetical protein
MDANGLLEMAGEVRFASDHTFTEREWDASNSLADSGDWHVRGDKLVLDFHGDMSRNTPNQTLQPTAGRSDV